MRIGIDARELTGHPTGVGRYLAQVVTRWIRLPAAAAHEFVLYLPAAGGPLPAPFDETDTGARRSVTRVAGAPGVWWEQVRLPRAAAGARLDRFFAPAYSGPLAVRVPLVLTIHDVSFVAHPEWFGWREGLRRRLTTRLAARRARLVLTDTEYSRQQITDRLGIPRDRVRVIPLGVTSMAVHQGRVDHAREPLVLFVGSILARRRVPDLLRAFATVAHEHPETRLVIVGENRSHPAVDLDGLAARLGVANRVRMTAYVSESALADLYGRARVFVFLSEYEGFGLTPLEALGAGVPVVALDTPVAREVYGAAAWLVRQGDLEGTAAAIRRLLFDEEARRRQLALAAAVLARYSWDRAAGATLTAILEAGP